MFKCSILVEKSWLVLVVLPYCNKELTKADNGYSCYDYGSRIPRPMWVQPKFLSQELAYLEELQQLSKQNDYVTGCNYQ